MATTPPPFRPDAVAPVSTEMAVAVAGVGTGTAAERRASLTSSAAAAAADGQSARDRIAKAASSSAVVSAATPAPAAGAATARLGKRFSLARRRSTVTDATGAQPPSPTRVAAAATPTGETKPTRGASMSESMQAFFARARSRRSLIATVTVAASLAADGPAAAATTAAAPAAASAPDPAADLPATLEAAAAKAARREQRRAAAAAYKAADASAPASSDDEAMSADLPPSDPGVSEAGSDLYVGKAGPGRGGLPAPRFQLLLDINGAAAANGTALPTPVGSPTPSTARRLTVLDGGLSRSGSTDEFAALMGQDDGEDEDEADDDEPDTVASPGALDRGESSGSLTPVPDGNGATTADASAPPPPAASARLAAPRPSFQARLRQAVASRVRKNTDAASVAASSSSETLARARSASTTSSRASTETAEVPEPKPSAAGLLPSSQSTRAQLEKARRALTRAVNRHGKGIAQLKALQQELRTKLAADLKRLRDYQLAPILAAHRRQLYFAELSVLLCKQRRDEAVLWALQSRIDLISQALQAPEDWAGPPPESLIISPKRLLNSEQMATKLARWAAAIKAASERRTAAMQQYRELARKADAKWTDESRRFVMLTLMEGGSTETTANYHHDSNGASLMQFARIVADTRTIHGRQLAQMIHRCLTDPTVEDVDILGSLRAYTDRICIDYGLDLDQHWWYLRLLVDRLIFTSLHTTLFPKCAGIENADEMDDKYARALRALRQLTPQDIEVDEQYLPEPGSNAAPFEHAIGTLSDVSLLLAPAEILMCLTTALEEMCNEAGTNATLRRRAQQRADEASAAAAAAAAGAADGARGDAAATAPASPATKKAAWEQTQMMSADSLMPIVIYCLIHAQLILPHQTFVYVHIYADSAFKGGRFAYCLATFEAALYHVSHRLGPQALGEAVLDDALDSFGSLHDDDPPVHEPAAVSAAGNDTGVAELPATASAED